MAAPIFRAYAPNQKFLDEGLDQLIKETAHELKEFTAQQLRKASREADEQVGPQAARGVFRDGGIEAQGRIVIFKQRMRDTSDQCSTCLDASARLVNEKVLEKTAKAVSLVVVKKLEKTVATFC